MLHSFSIFKYLAWFTLCLIGVSIDWHRGQDFIKISGIQNFIPLWSGSSSTPNLNIINETTLTLRSTGDDIVLKDLIAKATGVLKMDDRDCMICRNSGTFAQG